MPLVCALVLLLVGFSAARAAPNEIDKWLKNHNQQVLFNGRLQLIQLSANASSEQLVAALHTTNAAYRIVETEKISDLRKAVLIAHDDNSKTIFIFWFLPSLKGWDWRSSDLITKP